jgi:hypothetical protein
MTTGGNIQEFGTPTSTSTTGSSGGSSIKPCRFFAMGVCRNGQACAFSHDAAPDAGLAMTRGPPPLIVNVPPGLPLFSVDVECSATSVQHNGRAILQVALVDEWARPVFNILIKQDIPVLSYLTPLTGITK